MTVVVVALVAAGVLLAVLYLTVRLVHEYLPDVVSRRVLKAEATRQAAVIVAEGEKQAAILKAEGDRQAAVLRAEGFALALGRVFEVAQTVDANTMRLQYLEALKTIGASDATKIVLPLELANTLAELATRTRG